MDRYLLISSDGHAGLPPEKYREYLDPQYRDQFDVALPIEIAAREKAEEKFLVKEFNEEWRKGTADELAGAWDPEIRTKVIDGDGVAAEVLFPDGITERNAPPFGADIGLRPSANPELQWAGAQAHNRWMAEFVKDDPVRRIGLCIIPALYDMDKNIAEIKWAKKNGFSGIIIPALMDGYDSYNNPKYYPMWELCQEYDMPVNVHSGAAPPFDDQPGMMGIYLTEFAFWMTRPMWFMIFGGVFEKFPKLKLVFTEGSEFWTPWVLELMDIRSSVKHTSGKLGNFNSNLTMKPSEYFARNVWVGASALADSDTTKSYYEIGIDRVMWGTDYPHPEGTWPRTHEKLMASLKGVPEEDLNKMLHKNAFDVYSDLDEAALWKIAERIGPLKQDFLAEAAE